MLWILLVLPCMLGACRTSHIAGIPVEDPSLAAGQVEGPSPAGFRAQHRVTLTFRGKQLDFTGYLLVRRPGAWRAVAFGEFGGSLFDLAVFPGRGLRIIKNPGAIRERWLTGPAADMIEILCFADVPGGLQEAPVSVTKRNEVYTIRYSDYADFPGVEQKIPRHIVIENEKAKLRLEVDLIKLEPMEMPDSYFDI
ncbi:MAG: hypothetical protein AAB359_05790 [Elusimicrobiota bacterium]